MGTVPTSRSALAMTILSRQVVDPHIRPRAGSRGHPDRIGRSRPDPGTERPVQSSISRSEHAAPLAGLEFSDHPDGRAASLLRLPHPVSVLRHAVPVILESVVAPVAAYYLVLVVAGFRGALIGALTWSYFLVGRRLWRRERVSTLLWLGTLLLTLRTAISFVTGSAFLYFIQPTASAFLASLLLLLSVGSLLVAPFARCAECACNRGRSLIRR